MCENIFENKDKDEIVNSINGQHITILDSGHLHLLKMESIYLPFSNEPPMHFHPNQREHFEILEGELTVRYICGIKIYRSGQHFTVPAGTAHTMWNSGYPPAKISWTVEPALETENLIRTTCRLANRGQTDRNGKPNLLLMLYLLQRYRDCFRLRRPGIAVVTLLYWLFKPIYYFKNIHL